MTCEYINKCKNYPGLCYECGRVCNYHNPFPKYENKRLLESIKFNDAITRLMGLSRYEDLTLYMTLHPNDPDNVCMFWMKKGGGIGSYTHFVKYFDTSIDLDNIIQELKNMAFDYKIQLSKEE